IRALVLAVRLPACLTFPWSGVKYEPDRFQEVVGHKLGVARPMFVVLLRLPSVSCEYQHALSARVCSQIHVAGLVSDHKGAGEIDVVLASGLVQHTRMGLAADADLSVAIVADPRVMGTVVDPIQLSAVAGKLFTQPDMNLLEDLFGI